MPTRIWRFLKDNPVPVIALTGLVSGLILLAFGQEDAASVVWYIALVVGGAPLVWATLKGMLRGQFASDVVAMLAIVGTVVMDEPFAGVLVVLMQSGGEALERYGFQRATSSLTELLARAPRRAWRKQGNELEEIAVDDVQVGDMLTVRPGELIPTDGTLTQSAEVDESALTGEPLPLGKEAGDKLLSGSVNTAGAFEMHADAVAAQSQYARIVTLVRQAQEEKAPIMRLADQYAVWFTPLTLIMCGLGWFITADPNTIVAVLVVATPCPLILATPIAVISGINHAARRNIIVKGGTAIEQVGRAQAVVFDKTGTLTFGSPELQHIITANGMSQEDLLHKAASVEQLSSHLLGKTMTQAAQERVGRPLPIPEHFEEVAGRGVGGKVGDQHILVGSHHFLKERLATGEHETLSRLNDRASVGATLSAFVSVGGKAEGALLFSDQLRPGVPQLIERLKALGVKRTVMLTGDRAENAHPVAEAAGVDELDADLLPADKVAAVRQLAEKYHPLVMVGDGINDAPALATATVGVAMGARGSGISSEAADIVLLADDVTLVGETVAIGQRTLRIAKQSIYMGLGVSFGLMVFASFGFIPAPIGALCQEALDVAVILNALRAR